MIQTVLKPTSAHLPQLPTASVLHFNRDPISGQVIKRIPFLSITISESGESKVEESFFEAEEESWIGSLSRKYPIEGMWFVKKLSVYLEQGWILEQPVPREQFIIHMKGTLRLTTSHSVREVPPFSILAIKSLGKGKDSLRGIRIEEMGDDAGEGINAVLPVSESVRESA
ncbi:hypothetical protein T439DRAFT_359017 [Meredithblackwellia eburnea MCA 4105]